MPKQTQATNRSIAEVRLISHCAFAHAMRAYTHRCRSAKSEMRPSIEDFPNPQLASVLPPMNELHPARPIRGSVIAGRWGKHMFKRFETSAERLDERLDPWQLSRGNRTTRQVTRIRALKAAAATVVHDVQGPIVTGVLGGD